MLCADAAFCSFLKVTWREICACRILKADLDPKQSCVKPTCTRPLSVELRTYPMLPPEPVPVPPPRPWGLVWWGLGLQLPPAYGVCAVVAACPAPVGHRRLIAWCVRCGMCVQMTQSASHSAVRTQHSEVLAADKSRAYCRADPTGRRWCSAMGRPESEGVGLFSNPTPTLVVGSHQVARLGQGVPSVAL